MSGTRLKVRWMEFESGQPFPSPAGHSGMFVRVGVEPAERRCPACDSIVYSRRHKSCGVCGGALPESCLFTTDEAQRVDALLRTERQRHRDWLRRTGAA